MSAARSRLSGLDDLRRRVARASLKGAARDPAVARARKLLDLYLAQAEAQGVPLADLLRDARAGFIAVRIGGAELQAIAARSDGPFARVACEAGCAFCCVLAGDDGAVVLEAEARQVHAALAPRAGQPDGRAWHPRACPALDPATRMCRAYDARAMICRTYISPDVGPCTQIARGVAADGPGVVGAQTTYLAVQALLRAALKGMATLPSYDLARVAAAAVEGHPVDAALATARQKTRTLEDERLRMSQATSD